MNERQLVNTINRLTDNPSAMNAIRYKTLSPILTRCFFLTVTRPRLLVKPTSVVFLIRSQFVLFLFMPTYSICYINNS